MGIPNRKVDQHLPVFDVNLIAPHDFQVANQILQEFKEWEPFNFEDDWAHALIFRALEVGRKEGGQQDLHEPRPLSADEARSLTSREIAKIMAGIMGSFASWCDVDEIFDALNHIHDNQGEYRTKFKLIKSIANDVNPR